MWLIYDIFKILQSACVSDQVTLYTDHSQEFMQPDAAVIKAKYKYVFKLKLFIQIAMLII